MSDKMTQRKTTTRVRVKDVIKPRHFY